MSFLSILLCCGSFIYLWLLGFSNVLPTLGWSAFLLPVAWAGTFASARLKAYSRSILPFVFMLFGFIAVNHVGVLVVDKTIPTKSIWLFLLQVFIIWLPFISVITSITKKPVKFGVDKAMDFFGLWLACLAMGSATVFAPAWTDNLSPSRLLVLLCAPTLLYASLTFVMFLRMDRGEFEYLMNVTIRVPEQAKRFNRSAAFFFAFTVMSFGLESFRGRWLFAMLGCCSFGLLSANAYLIYRLIFLPLPSRVDKSIPFHFPLSYRALFLTMMSLLVWVLLYMVLAAKYR